MKFNLCLSAILSLSFLAGAIPSIQNRALRVSLQRRSLSATSVQSATGEQLSGAQRVASLIRYTHDKYAHTLAAYERNTGSRHPLDTQSGPSSTDLSKRATNGVVALSSQGAELWYGNFTIGTPPQPFRVDFDTGSADLIVPDRLCYVTCDGHNKYDPSKSSTSNATGVPFDALYGSGAAFGFQYSDSVGVGGYQVVNQRFGGAILYSYTFSSYLFVPDGLSGLGFQSISALRATTLKDNLKNSGQLPEPVFGFKLSTTAGESELLIGAVDSTAFDNATLTYVPVVPGYWEVTLDSFNRSSYQVSGNISSIIDTGTTLILAPQSIVSNYYSGIPGAKCNFESSGECTVPCNIINSTTPTLTFGGRAFTVSPETWNLGSNDLDPSNCIAGLAAFNLLSGIIVGDVFLRNVYSIFDFSDPPRVGFARLV